MAEGMIDPSLNHVFVIVPGVPWSSAERLALVLFSLWVGKAVNVRSVCRVRDELTCVLHKLLCWCLNGRLGCCCDVIKGHLKVVVYHGGSESSKHLTVFISLSLSLLNLLTSDLMHRHDVSVSAWQGKGSRAAHRAVHPPSTVLQLSIHYAFQWRAITLNHFWSTQEL